MLTDKDSLLNELKARIKLLEKQGSQGELYLEEKMLIWLVSESIRLSDEPDKLIFNVLERIGDILELSVSGFFKHSDDKLIPEIIYAPQNNVTQLDSIITLPPDLQEQLATGPIVLRKKSGDFDRLSFEKSFVFTPKVMAVFPFESLYMPSGAFVFINDAASKKIFPGLNLVIQQLVDMTKTKYEKIHIQDELKELNSTFENKLRERTRELENELDDLKKKTTVSKTTVNSDQLKRNFTFLKNVGVEVRTPLNGIMGFSEIIRDPDLSNDKKNDYIDLIKSCGNSLLKIVDDSVQFASFETFGIHLNKTEFSLTSFMTELYHEYQKDEMLSQREKVKLRLNININGNTKIETDRDKLILILSNLIRNSIKFTSKGYVEFGCLINSVKSKKQKGAKKELSFFVKDSGVGISSVHQPFIFDPFYKVEHEISKHYGGLGLGLTITKKLVEAFGGEIWLESAEKKGTAFYFSLPGSLVESYLEKSDNGGYSPSYDWSDKNILIVEDDPMSYIYLKEVLKSTQASIIHAPDGRKAIEIASGREDLDIVLMDIKLPGISGFDATKEIKKFSDIPVIAQTAYAMADDYKKILKVGCDDYISKPINRNKLLKKIESFFLHEQQSVAE